MTTSETFETAYPHYPFAPLVRAGIAIAAWITRRRPDSGADRVVGSPPEGGVTSSAVQRGGIALTP